MTCENNATCIRTAPTRYACHCLAGYAGMQCEYLQNVNFNKESYIALPSLAERSNFSIKFAFRTTVKNGLLMYQGKVSLFAKSLLNIVYVSKAFRNCRKCFPSL